MDFREVLSMSFDSIRTNKLRASLTILGIVIGVFSVISVMTAVQTLENSINSGLNVMGTNSFIIQKYPAIQMGMGNRWKFRNRQDITWEQCKFVKEKNEKALYVSITENQGGGLVSSDYETSRPNVDVAGSDEATLATLGKNLGTGRNFTEGEIESSRNIAILGVELATKLFPNMNPIGQTVKMKGSRFEIIGVMEKQGSSFGQSQDNVIYIPITIFIRMYNEKSLSIAVMAPNSESYADVEDHITGLLRLARKVPPGEDNDFEIFSNESLIETFRNFTIIFSGAAGGISFIALLAAGIGIMNIMLVSVTERTREIGVRKAIGARKQDIMRQFLYEAIVLSQVGGLIGIFFGVLGGNLVALFMDIAPTFPWLWALIGITVCTIIGVVFGIYPAWKASQLDPIEALRYE
ncbi:MAG: ABC transporter permease [Bacteroidetes bacterium]|nr:ABC transporter permease [Bacteroidota bacterium]